MKLFPAAGLLEFIGKELFGPLPETKMGYKYIIVFTDRFPKLTRAIPLKITTSLALVEAFLIHWVYPHIP